VNYNGFTIERKEKPLQTVTIEICPSCEGRGFAVQELMLDYHKRQTKSLRTPCPTCKGSGRVLKSITEVVAPYVQQKISEEVEH
jgi:Ribonuclease G/E